MGGRVLLNLMSTFLDIANILFFAGGISQFLCSYRNRENLYQISYWLLLGCMTGGTLFVIANTAFGAIIGGAINVISVGFYSTQMYWKLKYRHLRGIRLEGPMNLTKEMIEDVTY
jgi:hypothetical protein